MRARTDNVSFVHYISTVHSCDLRRVLYRNIMNSFWPITARALLWTFYNSYRKNQTKTLTNVELPILMYFPLDLHNRGICRHLLSVQTHNVNLSVSKRIELTSTTKTNKGYFWDIHLYEWDASQLLLSICLLNHAVHVSCLVTTVFLTERWLTNREALTVFCSVVKHAGSGSSTKEV